MDLVQNWNRFQTYRQMHACLPFALEADIIVYTNRNRHLESSLCVHCTFRLKKESFKIFHSINFNENLTSRAKRTQFVGLFGIYWSHFLTKKFHSYIDVNFTGKGGKIRPLLGSYGLWAGRDLYRATPALTRGLGFCGLVRRTVPLPWLVQQERATADLLEPGSHEKKRTQR